jgi:8-oxo-dGTP pyrophosphatase MutT (NUDIX family)
MKKLLQAIGFVIFWCGWPVLYVYFRRSQRTRVLIVHEGDIVVLRTWLAGNTKWGMPGGGKHKDETPVQGAIREVREEVGIELKPEQLRLLFTTMFHDKGFRFPCYYFVAELSERTSFTRQKHEIADIRWVDPTTAAPDTLLRDVHEALAAYHASKSAMSRHQ